MITVEYDMLNSRYGRRANAAISGGFTISYGHDPYVAAVAGRNDGFPSVRVEQQFGPYRAVVVDRIEGSPLELLGAKGDWTYWGRLEKLTFYGIA
jgi:hypothetical protein